jgi:HTH-type transcriptional regulator/antitoxin HigA
MDMTTVADAAIASPPGVDSKRYGRLLVKFAPKVIETEAENVAALAIVERLMEKGERNLTRDEAVMLDLLSALIENFEDKAYPIRDAEPKDVLLDLMEHRNLRATDIAPIVGSRAKASEILSGKRAISKEQARRLGEFFRISPAAFI